MKSIQRRIGVIIVQAKRCLKSLVWGLSDHSSRIAPQSKFGQFWVMKYLPAQFSLKPLDMQKCLYYGKSTGFLPGDCQKNFFGLGPFKHIENAFCITIEAKLLHKLWLGRDPRGMIVQTLGLTYLTPLGMHYNQTHPPLNPLYLTRPIRAGFFLNIFSKTQLDENSKNFKTQPIFSAKLMIFPRKLIFPAT